MARVKEEHRRPAPVKKEGRNRVYRDISVEPRHQAIMGFLNENAAFITVRDFAEAVGCDNANLGKAIKGTKQATGLPCTLPERYWDAAEAEIKNIKEKFKRASKCL